MNNISNRSRLNSEITAAKVVLIDQAGESLGVISLDQAKFLAFEEGVDLMEVNPNINPPICKLIDFGKYKYEMEKREKRKPSHHGEIKEIQLSYKIDKHDLETKARRAKEFLGKGYKVRAYIILRGRENIFQNQAKEKISNFIYLTEGQMDGQMNKLGNRISVMISK